MKKLWHPEGAASFIVTLMLRRQSARVSGPDLSCFTARAVITDNSSCAPELRGPMHLQRPVEMYGLLKGPGCYDRAKRLDEVMGRIKFLFFNGLSLEICCHRRQHCTMDLQGQDIKDVFGNILSMPLKHLEFTWRGEEDCLVGQILIRFLTILATLEYLKVGELATNVKQEDSSRSREEYCLLSLKILEICGGYDYSTMHSDLLTQIIRLAPGWEELKMMMYSRLVPLMRAGTLRLVKSLWLESSGRPDFVRNLEKITQKMPKLRRFTFRDLVSQFGRSAPGPVILQESWPYLLQR